MAEINYLLKRTIWFLDRPASLTVPDIVEGAKKLLKDQPILLEKLPDLAQVLKDLEKMTAEELAPFLKKEYVTRGPPYELGSDGTFEKQGTRSY